MTRDAGIDVRTSQKRYWRTPVNDLRRDLKSSAPIRSVYQAFDLVLSTPCLKLQRVDQPSPAATIGWEVAVL
jgi:hypothetical protein